MMPIDFWIGLFSEDRWMPRWQCGKWEPWEGWLYITSDVLIAVAYFTIPAIIASFILRRKSELPFLKVFWLFFMFIFLCGTTHLIDAIIFWHPVYQLSAFVRAATAMVSLGTVAALIYYLPEAVKLKTAVQFEKELEERGIIETEIKQKYKELEIAQRIARIGHYRYTYDNPAFDGSKLFYEILGIQREQAYTSAQLRESIEPDDRSKVEKTLKETREHGTDFEMQYRYYKPNGELVYIYSKGEALRDGNGATIGITGFLQDVTHLKLTEKNLEQRAYELESINKELELFAYAASHDLQEPLRKIRAFADRLVQKHRAALDEQGQDYLGRIDNAADRMQMLIDDLLSYSRLTKNKDQKEEVDLNTLINDVLSDLEESVNEKAAIIKVEKLPTVVAVPGQMRQLLQNLISNALKFTKKGTQPQISVTCTTVKGRELAWRDELEQTKMYFLIEISDNGIGFDPQYGDKIFVMFQRLHGKSDYKGTGIGLALCKKIVENHGGLIKAHGEPDHGATFSIVLPAKKS